jgi:hypothetical protein
MITISELENAIRDSWDASTSSYQDDWSKDNPSYGQCAVTALVLNDYLGGEIVWANVELPDGKFESHYFNKVLGEEKDLTREQFPEGSIVPKGVPKCKDFASTREYVLSYPVTQQRYAILKERVDEKVDSY